MNKFWGNKIGLIFYVLFAVAFVFILYKLFFADVIVKGVGGGSTKTTLRTAVDFSIIYPEEAENLESTSTTPSTKQRLVNIYEALVKPDADLNMKTGLALHWGIVDDLDWEFTLRDGLLFHDGSTFDAADVLASYNRAMEREDSQLRNYLANIKDVTILAPNKIRITTYKPDPLLLQKLANLFIVPSEYEKQNLDVPVGTGPYRFKSWSRGKELLLEAFPDYWNGQPKFSAVRIHSEVDKFERVNRFLRSEDDFLAFVPFDGVDVVVNQGFRISSIPSLEVQFLLFNFNSSVFKNREARAYVASVLDSADLVRALGSFVRQVNQFVSSGIFGYNPSISPVKFDKNLLPDLSKETLSFHLPAGLTVLGEYVRQNLAQEGIDVLVSYLSGDDFMKSLQAGDADIYFLGYRSELGDASGFLNSVAHTNAEYNFVSYSNAVVDQLIDSSLTDMDVANRRRSLQEAMKIITDADVLAVPLFEYETVFAYNNKINFLPRIDGLIYYNDLIVN